GTNGLDGATGPTGPTGAAGLAGATGPTGPTGAGAQVLSSTTETLIAGGTGTFSGPTCPAGTTAVWGGVTQTAGTGPLNVQSGTGGAAWTVTVVNNGADTASFTVQSVCQSAS
ncbi:collagen-like protein, partial [Streptomyces shenzhenensis]